MNLPFKLPLVCKQCFNMWGFSVFKILCLVCHDDWRDYRRSTIRWRHFQPNIVPMLPMRIPKAVKVLRQLWLLTLSHGISEIFHGPTAKKCIIPILYQGQHSNIFFLESFRVQSMLADRVCFVWFLLLWSSAYSYRKLSFFYKWFQSSSAMNKICGMEIVRWKITSLF